MLSRYKDKAEFVEDKFRVPVLFWQRKVPEISDVSTDV
jgi:hypothetical protein